MAGDYRIQRFMEARRNASEQRMSELRDALRTERAIKSRTNVTIFAAGSFGRSEASRGSDLDLFVVEDDRTAPAMDRLQRIEFVSAIASSGRGLGFPAFSKEGDYLHPHLLTKMRKNLGDAEDDTTNAFTARMLMLLESTPVYGKSTYNAIIGALLDEYWRDYRDHARDFRPIFLLNDVMRYWKTLCLNYESKRNEPTDSASKKAEQHRKDLKLKYSRLVICFGLVIPLATGRYRTKADILSLLRRTPLERLEAAAGSNSSAQDIVEEIKERYVAFLRTDEDSKTLLRRLRRDKNWQQELTAGDDFAELIFSLLLACTIGAGGRHFLRYVVV